MKKLAIKRYYKDKRDDLYKVISYDEDKCDYRMMKLDTFFYNIETLVVIHTDKVADYEFKERPTSSNQTITFECHKKKED